MKRPYKITAYVGYGLVAAVFFAYYLFPQQKVLQMAANAALAIDPQLHLEAKQVKPKLPPGLTFSQVSLDWNGIAVAGADRVKITPRLTSLFSPRKEIGFTASLGEGSINGRVDLDRKLKDRPAKLVATASSIPLEKIALLKQWPQVRAQGQVNARLDYDGRKGVNGTAHLEVAASNVVAELQLPLLPLDRLVFSRIEARLTLTGSRLTIKRCKIEGEQLSGKVTGSITLLKPQQRSRLNLTCTLKPEAGLSPAATMSLGLLTGGRKGGPITIRISGTFENPRYTLR